MSDEQLNNLFITFDGSMLKRDRTAILEMFTGYCGCIIDDKDTHRFRKIFKSENEYFYHLMLKTKTMKNVDLVYSLLLDAYFKSENRVVKFQVNNTAELIANAVDE